MAIEIEDLQQLDADLVEQQLEQARTQLQELHPELDLKRGVFHDTLVYFHALLAASQRTTFQRYLSARSLKQIEEDPSLADESVVDDVLSNWGLTRQSGSAASGEVTIVLSSNTSVTVGSGALFTANGRQFVTNDVFTAKAEEALLAGDNDRLLTQISAGRWAFTIEVTAAEEGPEGRLAKDTIILPAAQPVNFVTAYATSDFSGGEQTETNDALLARLQQGVAAEALSNRVNMAAMLRAREEYSRVVAMSIVGYGDQEMLRDQRSILPISFGSRVDWYIRTEERVQRTALTKEATLVEKTSDGRGIWQASIAAADAPGFYELRNIRLPGSTDAGGFSITAETRALDLTGDGLLPDVETVAEGAYTAFQTSVIQFEDTVTDTDSLSLSSKQDYELEAWSLPKIGELQTLISSRDVRFFGADALVKAPVPCFVHVTLTVNKETGEPDPDIDQIKTDLMEIVHNTGFTGRLDGSFLVDAVHNHLQNTSSVTGLDLLGRIRQPDGTEIYLRDDEVLQVKDDPANMVTAKTVQFFLEPEDIAVNVATIVPVAD